MLQVLPRARHGRRRRVGHALPRAAGVRLADLDIHVITAPSVRLDVADDQRRLADTVAELRPRLLILDPLVRLHRVDENVASEVAPLLAYLRELQRTHQVAVVLVHHARKGAGRLRAGQALRGSSELHAWGDSNLYLRRVDDQLLLSVEHRAAASHGGLALGLRGAGDVLALEVLDPTSVVAASKPVEPSVADKVEQLLVDAAAPVRLAALRKSCRIRAATLGDALADLQRTGKIRKTAAGFELVSR